jgi:RNA polymerase sigma-70 factor (ECF subfamily)
MGDKEERWRHWMLASRAGDEAAYKLLLQDLARHVRIWARRGMRNSGHGDADLEDVVQETLLAFHLKRHTWDANERFSPWLNAIVRYKVIDAMRRRNSARWVPIEDFADVLAAVDDQPALGRRDIVKMAQSLPEKQRAVVVAMFVDGLSTAETAAHLKLSQGAVRVTLHRALSSLARQFGGD